MLIQGKISFGQFVYVIDNSWSINQLGDHKYPGPTFCQPNIFIVLQTDLNKQDIPQVEDVKSKFNDTVIYHEETHRLYYIHSGFIRAVIKSK